jgi:sugar (pentulose or hexulose) kinase
MTGASGEVLVGGIDVGTQGVRVVVVDLTGELLARASEPLPRSPTSAANIAEQDPETWWSAVCRCLRRVLAEIDATRLSGLAVSATSGTLVLTDDSDRPLRPALMYNDARATAEALEITAAAGGNRATPSDPLAKLLWLRRHEPKAFVAARRIVHAGDFIAAKLTGEWRTDWSQALKSGYDPGDLRWSPVLALVELDCERFPQVIAPGAEIGGVTGSACESTGLRRATRVFAGMTDGCASQIAAGAMAPGQWCSTLGTTLVVRGVTRERLHDPLGRVYSHRHPDGFWMPGGASNTGGECLQREFPADDLALCDRQAAGLTPTDLVAYPLVRTGERFPFVDPQAEGFLLGTPASRAEHFTACLEGVAYLERLAYETLDHLGARVDGAIAASGGGANSRVWMQIRADVLGRPLRKPALPEAAAGAAIIAAAAITNEPISARANAMVRMTAEVVPRENASQRYREAYQRFVGALKSRGYLPG